MRRKDREKTDRAVCGRTMNVSSSAKRKLTKKWNHEVGTCRLCIKNWIIKSHLKSRGWNHISCTECRCEMDHDDIKAFAVKSIFNESV